MTVGSFQPRYISLRWRLVLPLFIATIIAVMAGAYALGQRLTQAAGAPQINLLVQTGDGLRNRSNELYEQMRLEAQRVAFTRGVADAVRTRAAAELHPILESSARLANLDSIIVTDEQAVEVTGVLRVEQQSNVAYTVSTDTDLHIQSVVRAVLDEHSVGAAGLLRTPSGLLLYTAVPLMDAKQLVGIVLVGRTLDNVLADLKTDSMADLALYGSDGGLLQTTTHPVDSTASQLTLSADVFNQTLAVPDQLTLRSIQLNNQAYQAAYSSFQFGSQPIGVIALFLPDSVPTIAQTGQQLGGLTLAAVAGAAVIALFIATYFYVIHPAGVVTSAAESLTAGNSFVRTGMQPTNEIAAAGHALDQYADYVQERQDALRASLRRQRRESEYLLSVLESMPDGVVVHDQNGQIVVMNEKARVLLGTQPEDKLGLRDFSTPSKSAVHPLAPGLYTLGDPRRLEFDGHMVSAQAAALFNISDERVGTLVVLRDITREVRRAQIHEAMLKRLSNEVQLSPQSAPQMGVLPSPMSEVAHDLGRHSAALQKIIFEMRELTMPDAPQMREAQHPLYLDTLVWVIANEWRQIATAANLSLEVLIEERGLFILGDERRLRWAIGNLVDNAIKYTLPGGKLTLEINGESDGRALMRVRDNGVGIVREEIPHLTTRFYRGTPRTTDGDILHVPGTGQGLYVAKQVIEAHGGLLQIKSKVGIGTAVYFALPVTASVSYKLPVLPHEFDLEGETVRLKRNNL
ncbi:MAG: PAS domain-containing protein [Anaerolineaceae bacterium]|nr:PAS domain-containing protein [Anaerolineaceae bacterium]